MQQIQNILEKRLSPSRWQHSRRVAETAQELAQKWGADSQKAWMAGLVHDIAREMSDKQLIDLAREIGHNMLGEEIISPVILHAPVGAYLATKEFGITDPAVLSAVEKHTVGGVPMTLLDKIIYLADLIEPGRTWRGVNELRKTAFTDIDHAMLVAFDGTIEYLKRENKPIHPTTLRAREEISSFLSTRRREN